MTEQNGVTLVDVKAQLSPPPVDNKGMIIGEGSVVWLAVLSDGQTMPLSVIAPSLAKALDMAYGVDARGALVIKGTSIPVTQEDIRRAVMQYIAQQEGKEVETPQGYATREQAEDVLRQAGEEPADYIIYQRPDGFYTFTRGQKKPAGFASEQEAWDWVRSQYAPRVVYSEDGYQVQPYSEQELYDVGWEVTFDPETRSYVPQQRTLRGYKTQQEADAAGIARYGTGQYRIYRLADGSYDVVAAGQQAQPLAAPEFVTGDDGKLYARYVAGGPWEPVDKRGVRERFEDIMYEALLKGDTQTFLDMHDLQNAPTPSERFDMALQVYDRLLQAASSPADYMTIWLMARGEAPLPTGGPYERVAPYAAWFQQALDNLLGWTNQVGLPVSEITKAATGQSGPTGSVAQMGWNDIQGMLGIFANLAPPPVTNRFGVPMEKAEPEEGATPPLPQRSAPAVTNRFGVPVEKAEPEEGATPPLPQRAAPPVTGYPPGVSFPMEEGGGMVYTPPSAAPPSPPSASAVQPATGRGELYSDKTLDAAEQARLAYEERRRSADEATQAYYARQAVGGMTPGGNTTPGAPVSTSTRVTRPKAPSEPPPFLRDVIAGRTVQPPVNNISRILNIPPPSPESYRNMLPSERQALQSFIAARGVYGPDWEEERRRATEPTGRYYRRGITRRAFVGV